MRSLNKYLLAITFSFSVYLVIAQKQSPPAGGKAKDFKLPAKKVKTFENGLRTVGVKYGEIPKVTIALFIKTGNIHEAPDEIWLADLTAKMMMQGTGHMDFKTLSKKAAQMGGEVNINVGMDQVNISGTVLSEFAPDFIKFLADITMNPSFPADELDRLKDDLKRRLIVQKAIPQPQAEEKLFEVIYKEHRYGKYFPTEKMIESYSLQMVKDFYNNNFGAKRSVLYVAGKYDEAKVNTIVANSFGKWKAGPAVLYPAATVNSRRDTAFIDRKGAPQTTLLIGLPALTPTDRDYVPQLVTNSLLGGSFGSRITTNIREDKGYTYSPRSYIRNNIGTSLWIEQADITSEHTIEALQEIEKEIKRLKNEPPSKEELEGIQNYEAGVFVLQNSSPDEIINQLNFLDQYGLDDGFLSNLIKNIYHVTPEKVSEIAKNNFKSAKLVLVMVGDKSMIEKQLDSKKK